MLPEFAELMSRQYLQTVSDYLTAEIKRD